MENTIIHNNWVNVLAKMQDKSVDAVITDPPYLYLDHKLDAEFDEELFWKEVVRVTKDDAFIVFSGRGDSFYKWNRILFDLGTKFKEEIIWYKTTISSPVHVLKRNHETIAVRQKGNKTLNKVKINYVNNCLLDENERKIIDFIKTINADFKKHRDEFLKYLDTGIIEYNGAVKKQGITASNSVKDCIGGIQNFAGLMNGVSLRSVVLCQRDNTLEAIHPTQKPVELWEILIKLCTNENDLILDPFSGSGTTAVASWNLNRKFICIEKDDEYYGKSIRRFDEHTRQGKLF